MKVRIDGKFVVIKEKSTVTDALAAARFNPETVLVKRKGSLIPSDEPLKSGDYLETIKVVSGG